jgi:hypothetical protein
MIIIGILHILIFGIFLSFYPFIIKKNFIYDISYIILMSLMIFSWIIYDNECIIGYYYKKYINDKDDIEDIAPSNSIIYKVFLVVISIAIIFSIYITSIRSNIMSIKITLLFIFIRFFYLFFNNAIGFNFRSFFGFFLTTQNYDELVKYYKLNTLYYIVNPYVNKLIFIINLSILIYIIINNKNKLLTYIK